MNKRSDKADQDLLFKGILIGLIGLAVLLAPTFMSASGMRDVLLSSSLVGWFALVLGGAFIGQYALRRRAAGKARPPDSL